MTRTCYVCKIEKSLDDFHNSKGRSLGKRYECKPCGGRLQVTRYFKNKDKFRAKTKAYQLRKKIQVLTHYAGGTPVCNCCKESEIKFLCLDHKNNDGAAHRRQLAGSNNYGGRMIYVWAIKNEFPPIFQVLCFNCNMAKGFYKSCPHSEVL